jgi:hypothetical protein
LMYFYHKEQLYLESFKTHSWLKIIFGNWYPVLDKRRF